MSIPRMTPDMIVLHADDNVATALKDIRAGSMARVVGPNGRLPDVTVTSEIRLGHKAATRPVGLGELVVKHGTPFGRATAAIATGEHVHVHNVSSLSRETDLRPQGAAHE